MTKTDTLLRDLDAAGADPHIPPTYAALARLAAEQIRKLRRQLGAQEKRLQTKKVSKK